MKLAQALQIRTDLQNRSEEIRDRLVQNATYQEGEKPAEDPVKLKKELDDIISQLQDYIFRIHQTNSEVKTPQGSLSELLSKRDALTLKRSIYKSFVDEAANLSPRYGRNEIKMFPSVDVTTVRKELDEISKELRELEMTIQEANWTNDLV